MATDKLILNKGIKYLSWALPTFFIGPTIVHVAFLNPLQPTYYLILVIGVLICITGILLTFIGLKTIVKSLFGN